MKDLCCWVICGAGHASIQSETVTGRYGLYSARFWQWLVDACATHTLTLGLLTTLALLHTEREDDAEAVTFSDESSSEAAGSERCGTVARCSKRH